MPAVVHVTHEAIQKIGGIGAVLQGMLTSRVYLDGVPRNILVGPFWPSDEAGEDRLGPRGEVLYSSLDGIFRTPLAGQLQDIEQNFGVGIIYGRRCFHDKETGVSSSPEVLLLDVSRSDPGKVGAFKYELWKQFGVESGRYEHIWDYEQYVRLAPPAIAVLHALGVTGSAGPCIILSHEYMGVPTALAGLMEGPQAGFRAVFHAHECATMRRIVEGHPGHDTMFYNVMRTAMAEGRHVEDVFGDQSGFYKHALIRTTRHFDNVFAVGDYTLKEMQFLGPEFAGVPMQPAYNGVPHWRISLDQKMQSRNQLRAYIKALLRHEPDHVFTHVTRLVPSKGMWRDLRVLEHLEPMLRARNETAVLLVLSTEGPARRGDDVRRMEKHYHWPVVHREGHPDLTGGEAAYYEGVQEFNACSRNIKIVFINQFGFQQDLCGLRMPAGMEFMDIRKGSDAEFGQSIYEPFGIAQVEPISFGGICIFSNICGCAGFVERITEGKPTPNVIIADYTQLEAGDASPEQLAEIGATRRNEIEHAVAEQVARELLDRLPRTPGQFQQFIDRGHDLAEQMSWDAVARNYLLPGFKRAIDGRQ